MLQNLLLTQVAVIWRCWFWTMNLNLSQAMAMMQKDDMKIGKSCPAFTNLHRYSVKGCDQWMAVSDGNHFA